MNWTQLRAMLWLRWRLTRNQWQRGGGLNAVIMLLVTISAMCLAVIGGVAGVAIGSLVLDDASPLAMMIAWDVLVGLFLFAWMVGLITELQRSELLDLGRLMHLPVSVKDVFLMNYVASTFSPSLAMALPAMLGLTFGLVLGRGLTMVLLVPLVLGFFLMITAWTYCLRGWLAALMVNKRRRRAVVMGLTMGLVLLAQLPNLVTQVWMRNERAASPAVRPGVRPMPTPIPQIDPNAPVAPLPPNWPTPVAQGPDAPIAQEPVAQTPIAPEPTAQRKPESERVATMMLAAHQWVPLLWLPQGAVGLAEGRVWPALAYSVAMLAIGAWGMIRAYRATIRFYQGGETNRRARAAAVPARAPVAGAPAAGASAAGAPVAGAPAARKRILVERVVPGVPEQAGAMAVACLRSMLRAPEIKMALVVNVVVFAMMGVGVFVSGPGSLPAAARPFVAAAVVGVTLLGMAQLMFNHFGFDRDGFRMMVLLPTPRRHVLLGKNLAVAPLAAGVFACLLTAAAVLARFGPWDLLVAAVEFVAAMLAMSALGNAASILTPYHVAAGSMKPTKMTATTGLLVFLTHGLMMMAMGPILLPAAVGLAFEHFTGWPGGPAALVCALAMTAVSAVLYWQTLGPLGRLLERRERRILQVVTREVE